MIIDPIPIGYNVLEPSCCKKLQKSPNQETGLENRGCQKVLNDQTMTEAEHNRPIPKFFGNRPSASAAEVFGETIGLVIY